MKNTDYPKSWWICMGVLAAAAIALTGCTAMVPPNTELQVDKVTQPMSRNEVINAIKDCEYAHLRPIMIMSKRRINGMNSDVVVDVTCGPSFGFPMPNYSLNTPKW